MHKRTLIQPDELWAGTDASLHAVRELEANFEMPETFALLSKEKEVADTGYEVHGGVAVMTIKGSLLNASIPRDIAAWFGVSTYELIQESLNTAAQDQNVKHILLDIHSGGGAVAGVSDTANLIADINANVKPVTSFTDSMMASAAYWLGCSAGRVFSSRTAAVGSIGVISTHFEYSKEMEQDGVTVTVLRAGEYKALASPYEPLSEKARQQIMDSLQHTYGIFLEHVANSRGTSVPVVKANMAEGKVFYGSDSEKVGLTDGTTTIHALLADLTQKVSVDNGNKRQENVTIKHGKRADMSDELKQASQEAALEADRKAEDIKADESVDTPAPSAAQSVANGNPLMELLQSAQAQVVDLKVQMATQSAKIEQFDKLAEQANQLAQIVNASLNQMRIALGHSALDVKDVAALLREHAQVSEAFAKTFPVGGVAATPVTEEEAPKSAQVQDPAMAARLRQTHFKPK